MSDSKSISASTRYFKLGLFVLITAALLVSGVIVLGAGAIFRPKIRAETLVYESVNGLDVGALVKYRGVPIGTVTRLIFASAKYPQAANAYVKKNGQNIGGILIEMSLDEKAFPEQTTREILRTAERLISLGLRARITASGISGQSFVDFDILNPERFPPPPMNWKPDELYIPSAPPSSFAEVLTSANDVVTELKDAHLGRIAHRLDDVAGQADATVAEILQIVRNNRENLNRALSELPVTSARLQATVARADEILHDPRVDQTLTGLSKAGNSADKTLADMRRLVNEAERLLAGERDDLISTLADLRRMAASGAGLFEDARANPSRLLFGSPPPYDYPSSSRHEK